MRTFVKTLRTTIFSLAFSFEHNKTLHAIRLGFLSMIPLVIVGTFSSMAAVVLQLLLSSRSIPIVTFMCEALRLLSSCISNYFSVVLVIMITGGFARTWKVANYHYIMQIPLALVCFFILTSADFSLYDLPVTGPFGTMSAIFAAVVSNWLYLYFVQRMNQDKYDFAYRVDPRFYGSMRAILPVLSIWLFFLITHALFLTISGGIRFQEYIYKGLSFIGTWIGTGSLGESLFYNTMVQALWFSGIHGTYALRSVVIEGEAALNANAAAAAVGEAPEQIINLLFSSTFVTIGGAGSTFALLLAVFCVSRNKTQRLICKIGLLPSLMNVNEILLFGLPVVANPVFFVPFLLVPLFNLCIAYYAVWLQLVPIVSTKIPWTTPIFFNSYLTSGTEGLLLQFLLLVLDFAIYLPFVRMHDEQCVRSFRYDVERLEEAYFHSEETGEKFHLTALPDPQKTVASLLIHDMKRAIQSKRLFLLYQPQFDVEGRFLGAEALLRWKHPSVGFVSPPLLVALAKTGHLLPELERFIFFEACRSISILEKHFKDGFKLSVNITGDSLLYDGLEETIDAAVERYRIHPETLWIEVTERDAIDSTTEALDKLTRIRQKGHELLIDDFGMGHTSIRYLQGNLFRVVKLNGSITKSVLTDGHSEKIIRSLTSLSDSMNIKVVAEFVETAAQRDKLAELGCHAFQGYLYSKPISLDELIVLGKELSSVR